ncbi:MAG: baseplate J/gp47 family protein, partial [Janthinobacterium lividum]
MFQTKDFLSIVASMINRMRATNATITDYNVGSVARTMVEAPAQEIDELYQQMVHAVVEAIPVAIYSSFNFPALGAVAASGLVQVTFATATAAFTIAAGTVLAAAGSAVGYVVQADVAVPVGATYANVAVVASTSGVGGNLAAGVSWTLSPVPSGFLAAANPSAFISGSQAETDAQHKLRFRSYISTLAKGTVAAINYGATSLVFLTDSTGAITERVQLCALVEPWVLDNTQPVGQFTLYIHNGVGSTSAAL